MVVVAFDKRFFRKRRILAGVRSERKEEFVERRE